MWELHEQALLNGGAAAVTAAFGITVLAGNPRRAPNQFLAVFLLLIAGNQAAEVARKLLTDPSAELVAFRIASVFASLDPLFLYAFASVYPERNRLNRSWAIGTVAVVCAVLAGFSVVRRPSLDSLAQQNLKLAWSLSTAIVYTVVLLHFGHQLREREDEPGLAWVFPAVAVATVATWPRVPEAFPPAVGSSQMRLTTLALLGVATLAWCWHASRTVQTPRARSSLQSGGLLGLLVALAVFAGDIQAVLPELPREIRTMRSYGITLRWLVFSFLVSAAVLRYQMLGLELRDRRRVARSLVTLGMAGAFAILVYGVTNLVGGVVLQLGVLEALLLAVVLVFSRGLRDFVDRCAELAYGVPRPGDPAAAAQAYQGALEQARREGRTIGTDPDLARLRSELEIDDRTADVLERTVVSEAVGPVFTGARIAGRYHVERALSPGSSADTYLARDELLERDVVLKDLTRDGSARERAIQEAKAAGRVINPNVLTVHDVLQGEDRAVVVTEYLPGGSLAQRLEDSPMDVAEAVSVVSSILSGLEAVHDEGVIHRDLKPANVLLTETGVPEIADFGIARVREGTTLHPGQAGEFAGTPRYMAPEQRRGEEATERTDVYAVGLILDEALPEDRPEALDAIVDRATAKDPEDRYASARRMRRGLEAVRDELGLE